MDEGLEHSSERKGSGTAGVECRCTATGRWREEVRAAEPPRGHPCTEKDADNVQRQMQTHTSYTKPNQNVLRPLLLWDCSAEGFQDWWMTLDWGKALQCDNYAEKLKFILGQGLQLKWR